MLGVVILPTICGVKSRLADTGFGVTVVRLSSSLNSFFGEADRNVMFLDGGVFPGAVGRLDAGVICFEGVTGFLAGVKTWFDVERVVERVTRLANLREAAAVFIAVGLDVMSCSRIAFLSGEFTSPEMDGLRDWSASATSSITVFVSIWLEPLECCRALSPEKILLIASEVCSSQVLGVSEDGAMMIPPNAMVTSIAVSSASELSFSD